MRVVSVMGCGKCITSQGATGAHLLFRRITALLSDALEHVGTTLLKSSNPSLIFWRRFCSLAMWAALRAEFIGPVLPELLPVLVSELATEPLRRRVGEVPFEAMGLEL